MLKSEDLLTLMIFNVTTKFEMEIILQSALKLSESERETLIDTYRNIKKHLDFFVVRFYHYFFQTDAKFFFKNTKMEDQFRMFSESLDLLISQVLYPNELFTNLKKLAIIHSRFGIKEEHISYFKDSFLLALKEIFNERENEEILDLWSVLLIDLMDYFRYEMK